MLTHELCLHAGNLGAVRCDAEQAAEMRMGTAGGWCEN